MNEQFIAMMLDGIFGEELKDVIVDGNRWQAIYDDLIDTPDEREILAESLRLMDVSFCPSARAEVPPEPAERIGPTTGPRPTGWTGNVTRVAEQPSFTYALRFGDRDLWKIGHALDVQSRLAEVNKPVPHEVLDERWTIALEQRWSSASRAYAMEQAVLSKFELPHAWVSVWLARRRILKPRGVTP